jgi:hypothetical protein
MFERSTARLDTFWEANFPYAGNATATTYMIDRKQYVPIATVERVIQWAHRAQHTSRSRYSNELPQGMSMSELAA